MQTVVSLGMPVGVPKVAYRLGEDQPAEWLDLYNCLFRERLLFCCQDLNQELGNQLIGILLYLNCEENDEDEVIMYINSPGGALICGIGLYDVINYVTADVTTICVGVAASICSMVLMGGATGKRIAFPNSRVMIHQPAGGSRGQISTVLSEADEMVRLKNEVINIFSERTGYSTEKIIADMGRDQYMSAREARDYGLVDHVGADLSVIRDDSASASESESESEPESASKSP